MFLLGIFRRMQHPAPFSVAKNVSCPFSYGQCTSFQWLKCGQPFSSNSCIAYFTTKVKQSYLTFISHYIDSADSRLIWQGAAPCDPFRRLICVLWPFSMLYKRPAALSICISESVCVSASKSLKRLLNAGTKSTKNHEKIHRRLRDHFQRTLFIITERIN